MIITLIFTIGCASGLNSIQKREYMAYKNNRVLVEEKDPGIGAFFGILPGGGSFYAREPLLGVLNLLLWPFSILWDPLSGYQGSMAINYDMTKYKLRKDKQREIGKLDDALSAGEINAKQYIGEKRKIDQKYDFE